MRLSLRPAVEQDLAFCESLNHGNMSEYLGARGISWDSDRFLASWAEFENLVIQLDAQDVGLLRLAAEQSGLGLRDLQILPMHQNHGIGSWAVCQALLPIMPWRRLPPIWLAPMPRMVASKALKSVWRVTQGSLVT